MTTTLAALLAATASYTAPVAGTADVDALPKVQGRTTSVNVKSAPLMAGAAPVKRAAKPAPSSDGTETKGEATAEKREGGTLVLLKPGTYDARQFLAAYRNAGTFEVTLPNGGTIRKTNATKVRNAQIQAMSGYKGYDLKGDFASQEITAKMHAKRETVGIAPGADRTQVRSAQHTAQGFVAGLPHPEVRLLQDLLGRERDIVATMGEHFKVAQDEGKSAQDRLIARNAIKQGETLLTAIRAEKAALGAEDVEDMPVDQRPR